MTLAKPLSSRSKPAVIVGMQAEARLLPGMTVGISGGDTFRALALSRQFLKDGASGLLSIGMAGGLAPGLPPGTMIIATSVDGFQGDPVWSDALADGLPQALRGKIIGSTVAITSPAAKAGLFQRTHALAVDMESGAVALAAHEAAKPFAVLRVIADPAERALPASALVGLGSEGETRPWAVIKSLVRHPHDLSGLLHVACDSQRAMRALKQALSRDFLSFLGL